MTEGKPGMTHKQYVKWALRNRPATLNDLYGLYKFCCGAIIVALIAVGIALLVAVNR